MADSATMNGSEAGPRPDGSGAGNEAPAAPPDAHALVTGSWPLSLPPEPQPLPSSSDFGAYRLVKQIGRGAMGLVYAAEHSLIGRPAAIKVLNEEWCANQEIVHRFLNEARAVNQARHENIVEITDLGTTAGGRLYIVMEMLEGIELARLLAGVHALPEARAAHIGEQIASALGAAHRAGVIHRDLKPANVMPIQRRVDCDFVKSSTSEWRSWRRWRTAPTGRARARCSALRGTRAPSRRRACPSTTGATSTLWVSSCTRW